MIGCPRKQCMNRTHMEDDYTTITLALTRVHGVSSSWHCAHSSDTPIPTLRNSSAGAKCGVSCFPCMLQHQACPTVGVCFFIVVLSNGSSTALPRNVSFFFCLREPRKLCNSSGGGVAWLQIRHAGPANRPHMQFELLCSYKPYLHPRTLLPP